MWLPPTCIWWSGLHPMQACRWDLIWDAPLHSPVSDSSESIHAHVRSWHLLVRPRLPLPSWKVWLFHQPRLIGSSLWYFFWRIKGHVQGPHQGGFLGKGEPPREDSVQLVMDLVTYSWHIQKTEVPLRANWERMCSTTHYFFVFFLTNESDDLTFFSKVSRLDVWHLEDRMSLSRLPSTQQCLLPFLFAQWVKEYPEINCRNFPTSVRFLPAMLS